MATNNNRRIALTEQEVQELQSGESIYITVDYPVLKDGKETTDSISVELYQGDEEDNFEDEEETL